MLLSIITAVIKHVNLRDGKSRCFNAFSVLEILIYNQRCIRFKLGDGISFSIEDIIKALSGYIRTNHFGFSVNIDN